jgi:serine/threonine kinase 16
MITLQQYILAWIHRLRVWFQELVDRFFGQVLSFEDSQIRVRVGRPLAEGGFSVVLRAVDLTQQQHTHHKVEYALKRIQCHDEETRQVCLHEAQVHQALQRAQPQNAKYLMPLYGMTWADDNNNRVCYMLFPLFPYSLRAEVHRRILNNPDVYENRRPPWNSESVVLQIFQHLLQAVATMHSLGYAHCDIKLDNILCKGSNVQHLTTPVLMDFGSARTPLHRSLRTRQDVLDVVDTASQHTTVSYRPPELFAGELRAGDDTTSNSNDLDYAKVDVWSCGCVLFAILFGASPCESEFHRRTGRLQIVDCTQLKVLQDRLPQPPADLPPAHWYSPQLLQLVEWILTKDRHQRPTIPQVQARVNHLLNGNNGHGGDIETQSSNPSFFETEPFAPFNGRSMTY